MISWEIVALAFGSLIVGLTGIIMTLAFFWIRFMHSRIDLKADKDMVADVKRDQNNIWQKMGEWSSNLNNAIETWRVNQEAMREKMHDNHNDLMKAFHNHVENDTARLEAVVERVVQRVMNGRQ